MKKTLLTLALATLTAVASYAQGTITFANTTLSRAQWEPTPGAAFVNVATGAPIVYGVFWGTSADNLVLNEGPLGTASTTSAGIIAAASPYSIVGGTEGSTYFMKVAGWSSSFQRDAAAAKATLGAHYGETGVREVRLAAAAGPGTVIWSSTDLTKFQPLRIPIVVPEPSVIALGVLGVGALLLRRKKA